MPDRVDLHIHTSYSSDADHSPDEILAMAKRLDLRAISITDHDSIEGSRSVQEPSGELGLEVVPAVEITTFFRGKELHILSYFIDFAAPEVDLQLKNIQALDEARSKQVIYLLNEMGIDVTYEEVKETSVHGAPKCSVIMKAAMANSRNNGLSLLRPYLTGSKSDQPYHNFFLDHMRPGGRAYVEPAMSYSSVDAIELSLSHGGVPVLAHPGGSLALPKELSVIDALRKKGLSGLEVFSSYHTASEETFLLDYCSRNGLSVTAGSDFHGATVKPNIHLGEIRFSSYRLVDQLRERCQLLLRA